MTPVLLALALAGTTNWITHECGNLTLSTPPGWAAVPFEVLQQCALAGGLTPSVLPRFRYGFAGPLNGPRQAYALIEAREGRVPPAQLRGCAGSTRGRRRTGRRPRSWTRGRHGRSYWFGI